MLEQVAEARVRLLGGAEARELPHRPEPAAVHRRVDAARERIRARVAEVALVVDRRVVGRVERLVLDARDRRGELARRAPGSPRTPRGASASVALAARGSSAAAMAGILGRAPVQLSRRNADNTPVKRSPPLPRRRRRRLAARRRLRRRVDHRHPRRRRSSRRPRSRSSRSTATRARRSGRTSTSSPTASRAARTRQAQLEDSLRSDAELDYSSRTSSPRSAPSSTSSGSTSRTTAQNVVGLMQPKDVDAFKRLVAKGNAQDPTDKLLVRGGRRLAGHGRPTRRASTPSRARVALDGPVLADDESFSQAMDDYGRRLAHQGLPERRHGDGRAAQVAARQDEAKFVDKIGNLDWIAAALRATAEGVRFDTTVRGTPGKLHPLVERRRDAELRARAARAAARRTCSPTSASTARRERSRGSQDNPIMKSPELKELRSLVGQVGTLRRGRERAVRAAVEGRHARGHARRPRPHEGTDGAATLDKILEGRRASRARSRADRDRRHRRAPRSSSATRASRSTTRTSTASSSSRTCPAGHRGGREPGRRRDEDSSLQRRDRRLGACPTASRASSTSTSAAGSASSRSSSGAPIPDAVKREREAAAVGGRVRGEPAERGPAHVLRPDRRARPDTDPSLGTTTSRPASPARRAGLPERLLARRVRGAGEHEEQVGEAVQVDGASGLTGRSRRGREHLALGAAAGGARDVQARGRLGAAREHEAAQLGQRRVRLVAVGLEPLDLRRRRRAACRRPRRTARRGRRRGRRARSGSARAARRARRPAPSRASELSSSTAPNARTSGSSFETREPSPSDVSPRVAAARVDPRQPDRLVALARAHRGTCLCRGARGRSRGAGSRSCPRRSR